MPTITIETEGQDPKKVIKALQKEFPDATIGTCGKSERGLRLSTAGDPAAMQITLSEILGNNKFLWQGL
ncbi:hypothetical protein COV49_02790 [Candidatus Falkowbacteria bacterium CG11_big_fil_rev_8_21_14_0_20_39_10]|uniref:Uncharacterized protein n=1 Tax=Candidatus Falkowbacteria bacterium CG11_big_fil_rev_8_21_14_0_20_39_10 TaxID=1974570 RepID=A0A2M6K8S2_9BACT|nr:MAG: hypothetical protein COV49_02790 [Candidatus Falkowbacteria bacterium CG11_big_fil_rev_8_21_14_0_20_39_10]